jgi:hypothetical protein
MLVRSSEGLVSATADNKLTTRHGHIHFHSLVHIHHRNYTYNYNCAHSHCIRDTVHQWSLFSPHYIQRMGRGSRFDCPVYAVSRELLWSTIWPGYLTSGCFSPSSLKFAAVAFGTTLINSVSTSAYGA